MPTKSKRSRFNPHTYRCVIEIDVDADTPVAAARLAWKTLTAPGAPLPVVSTIPTDENGDIPALIEEREDIDLEKLRRRRRRPRTSPRSSQHSASGKRN